MDLSSESVSANGSIVRPEFFYIAGFSNFPYASYYFLFLLFTYIVSVCGNSLVIFIIATQHKFHNPKYIGILNLAVADLGEVTALIPNLIKTFLFDAQYISYTACLSNMFFVFVFATLQCLTLVVLSLDRYVAICWPLRYHIIFTNRTMSIMITGMWAFDTLIVGITVALITRLSYCKTIIIESLFCDHGPLYRIACNDYSANFYMAELNRVLFLCLPLLFIVLAYLLILIALFRITSWDERLKALRTCTSHLLVVANFFLPIIAIYTAALIYRLDVNTRILCLSLSFAIPPMLNPIIYVLSTHEIKEYLRNMFKQRCHTIFPMNCYPTDESVFSRK